MKKSVNFVPNPVWYRGLLAVEHGKREVVRYGLVN